MWHSKLCLHPRSPPLLAVLTRMRNEYKRVQIAAVGAPYSVKESHYGEQRRQERYNYHRNKQEHHNQQQRQKQRQEQQRRQSRNANRITSTKEVNGTHNTNGSDVSCSTSSHNLSSSASSSYTSPSSSSFSRLTHTRYGESKRSNTNSASMIIEDKILEILSNDKGNLSQISDISINSPIFYIEVNKLLGLGALFHASTTTQLIAQAISYICQHIKQLTTVRQLMSACIPIINLQDGQTAGRNIVREFFLQPLINAVIYSIPCEYLDNDTVISANNTRNVNLESNTMRGGDNSTTTKQQNGMIYEHNNEAVGRGKVRSEVNLFEHMYEEEQLTREQNHCERLHQEQGQMQFAILSTFSLICKMLDVEDTPNNTIEIGKTYTTTVCNTEIKHNDGEVQRECFIIDAEYIMTLAELYEASCQHIIYLLKQRIATKNNISKACSTVSLSKATLANLAEFDQYFFEKNEMRVVIQAFLAIEKAARRLLEPRCSNKIESSSNPSFLQSHNNNFSNTIINKNNDYSNSTETNRQERNVEVAEVVKELYLSFSEILTLFMELLRPSLAQHNQLRTSHLLHLISLLSLVDKNEEAVSRLLQMILELIKLSVSHASKRDVIGIINAVTNMITRILPTTPSNKHSAKSDNDVIATAADNIASETHLFPTPSAPNSTIAAVVNSNFLNSLLSALRPQFFLLTSHQNSHLLTFQCDMLINKLVRWNKIEGVRVPDDLLCLLLSQLREQVHKATEQELLRYLRTLTKLHSSDTNSRNSSSSSSSINNTNGNNTESRWELASANLMKENMNTARTEYMQRHDSTRHEDTISKNETSLIYHHSSTNVGSLHDKCSTSHNEKSTNDDIHKCQNARNDSNHHNNVEEKVSHTQQDAKYDVIQSVINDCALRAMSLARENAISAANAARLIILLHHLSYNNLDDVFNSVLSLIEKSIQANVFEQTKDNNNTNNIKCNRSGHDNNLNMLDDATTLQNKTSISHNIKVEEGREIKMKNAPNSTTATGSDIAENDSYNGEVSTSESKSEGDVAKDESHRNENLADDQKNNDDDDDDDDENEEEEEEEIVDDDEQEGENEIVTNIDVDEESVNSSENKHLSYLRLLDAINLVMSSWDVNVFSSNYYHERVNMLRHNVMDRVESSLLQANTADELLNFYNKVRHSQKLLASNLVAGSVNTNCNNNNYCNHEYINTNGWNHSYDAMHSNIQAKQMNAGNENDITRKENKEEEEEENLENSDWRCSEGNSTNHKGVGSLEENASDDKGDEANENGLKPEEAGLGAFTMETFARRVEMMVPHCNAHQLCKLAFNVAACCQNGSVSVNRAHSVLERVFQHIGINIEVDNINGEQVENVFVLTATDAKFLIDAVRFSSSYHEAIPSVVYTTINNELIKICEVLNSEETNLINGDEHVENKLAIIDQVLNTVKSLTNYFKNIANIVSNKDKVNKELTLDSINDDIYNDESESDNNNVNNSPGDNNSNNISKSRSKNDSEDSRGKCSKQVIEDTRDNWHKIFSDDVRSAVCALELSLFKLLPIMLETKIDLPPAEFVSQTVVLVERATSLESVTNNLMQTKSIMVNENHVKERERREELEQKMQSQESQEFESEEHGEDAEHEDEQENDEICESNDYDVDKLQIEELEQEEEEEQEQEILEEFEAERDTNLKTSRAKPIRQVILISASSTHGLQIRLSLQQALFSMADLVSAVMFEFRTRLAGHKPFCIRSAEEYEYEYELEEKDVREMRFEESNATKRSIDHLKMQSINKIDKVIKTGNNSILTEEKESKNLGETTHTNRGELSSSDADSYKNNKIKENSISDNVTFQVDDLLTLLHCYVYAEVRHSELLKEIMTEIQLSASTMTLINLTEFLLYIMRNGITYSSSSYLLRCAVQAKIMNARIDECCYALYKIHLYEKEKMISPDNTPTTATENRSSDDAEATMPSVSMITTPMLGEMLIDRLNSFVNTETKWMTLANSDYALSEMMVVVNTISNFGAQAKHVHDAYYTIAVRACVVEMQDLFNAVSEHTTCKKENILTECTNTHCTNKRLENLKMPNSHHELESIEEYWPIYLTRLLDSIFRLLFRLPFLRNKEHARVSAYTLHKLVLMAADIVEICLSTFAGPQLRSLWSLTNSRMLERAFKAHAHFMTLYNVNFLQTIFEKKYALPWMLTSAIIRNNRQSSMQISVTNWTAIIKHITVSILFYERSEMEDNCAWMQLVQRWCAMAVEYFTAVCRPYTIPQSLPNTHLTTIVITEMMNGLIIIYEMLCGVNTTVSENCLHILRQMINCTVYRSIDRYTSYDNKQSHSPLDNAAHYTTSDSAAGGGGGGSSKKKELEKLSIPMLHSCVLLLQAHQNETTVLSNKEQEHFFQLIETILEEICTRKNLLFGDKMELLHTTLTNYMSSNKTNTDTKLTGVFDDLEQEKEKSQEYVAPTNLSLRTVMNEKNYADHNSNVDATTKYGSNEENADHEDSGDNINSKQLFSERLEMLLTKVRIYIAKEMMMSLTKDNAVIDVGEMFTRRLLLSLNCCLVRYVVRASMCHEQNYEDNNDNDKNSIMTINNAKSAVLTNIVQRTSNLTDISEGNNDVDSGNTFTISKNISRSSTKNNKIIESNVDDNDNDDDDVISIAYKSSKAKSREEALLACVDVLVNALLSLMRYKRTSMQQRGAVCDLSVHTRVARKILHACDDEVKTGGHGKNETVTQIYQLCKMLCAAEN